LGSFYAILICLKLKNNKDEKLKEEIVAFLEKEFHKVWNIARLNQSLLKLRLFIIMLTKDINVRVVLYLAQP
jgi:hypothetical protein